MIKYDEQGGILWGSTFFCGKWHDMRHNVRIKALPVWRFCSTLGSTTKYRSEHEYGGEFMEIDMIVWIAALIVAIIVEIITMGLTSIWFAGGALVALIAAALNGPLWLQIACFVVVSVLLLVFTRPVAIKYFNKGRVRTNAESVVGKKAIVVSTIDNLQGVGQVTVEGQEWSARSAEDGSVLEKGTVVEVVAISGVKLICKLLPQKKIAE